MNQTETKWKEGRNWAPFGRIDFICLWTLIAIGFLIRIWVATRWQVSLTGESVFRFGDSDSYWTIAKKIGQGLPYEYGGPNAKVFRSPLYPMFLAPWTWLDVADAGSSHRAVLAARMAGCVLGAICIAVVVQLSKRLVHRQTSLIAHAGLWAGLLVVLYPGAIGMSIFILSEAVFCPIMLLCIGCTAMAIRQQKLNHWELAWTWMLFSGALSGAACLARPSWSLWPAVLFLYLLFLMVFDRKEMTAKRLAIARWTISCVLFCVGVCLIMSPWWARNYMVTGKFVPTTLQVGASLYDGWHEGASGSSDEEMEFVNAFIADQRKQDQSDALAGIKPESTLEWRVDRRIRNAAIAWAIENSSDAIRLGLVKLYKTWSPLPVAKELGSDAVRWSEAIGYSAIMCFALIGMWRCRWEVGSWLYAMPCVYFALLHMFFIGSVRYRQPAILAICVLGGIGCAAVTQWLFGRRNEDRSKTRWIDSPKRCHGRQQPYLNPNQLLRRIRYVEVAIAFGSIEWFGCFLFAILGLWCYFSLMGRVDGKLTSEILKRLRKEFPTHIISVDRAHLLAGKSITIEGIRIAKPTDQGLRDVVRCGRLVCVGPFELIGLAQGQFPVQNVEADGVELCVWPLTDGRFSVQELSSSKPLSPSFPAIQVRSGLIRIGAETGRPEQEIILHDLRAFAELAPRLVNGHVMPLTAIANVSVSSSYFNTASLKAAINEDKTIWHAEGKVAKLAYSQRLAQQLPQKLQQYLVQAAGFNGELDAEFSARSDRGQLSYLAKATIANGRLLHPQVPYPLESISGEVICSNGLIQLRKVRAASGQATVAFDCDMKGVGIGSPITAAVSVQNLSLDQRLYDALPSALKETWQKLGVSGLIDAKATIEFDGKKWTPVVRVLAKDAGVEPEFFPYPIRRIHGVFVYQNDTVYAEKLTGQAGGQEIQCALTLTRASPRWLMDLKLAADGPIPIDEALLRALSQRGAPESGLHKFVLSLHPTGTVHLNRAHFQRLADQPEIVSRSLGDDLFRMRNQV